MYFNALPMQLMQQRIQQGTVVQLALFGQEVTLAESLRQGWFQQGDFLCADGLCMGQIWHPSLRGVELACESGGLWRVLAVPNHERAVLLKKYGLLQLRQKLRPAGQPVVPHAHHTDFGDGGFCKRRQHGCGNPCRRALGIGATGFVHHD